MPSQLALLLYADVAFEHAAQACWVKQQPGAKSILGKSGNTPGGF